MMIQALQQRFPKAEFVGIAGPKMQAVGCRTFSHGNAGSKRLCGSIA